MSRATAELAQFAAELEYRNIPDATVRHAVQIVLDGIGCAIFGSSLPPTRLLRDTLIEESQQGDVGVWGTDDRLDIRDAVLLNGYAIDSFESDDVHRDALIHVEPVVIPTALGLAEKWPTVSGREFVTAIVGACEVAARIGLCTGYGMITHGFHSAALTGSFCGAATAARLMRLSATETQHALGIAGTFASGLISAQRGSMVKAMHLGRAAQNGVYGALLARAGFTGIADILEAGYGGFVTTFSDVPDWDVLTAGLGTRWHTDDIAIKFYPCGASTHTAIDCALELALQVEPDAVQAIEVQTTRLTLDHAGWAFDPDEGPGAARLSIPWATAVAFCRGEVDARDFLDDALHDERLLGLARKVKVVEAPEMNETGLGGRHAVRMTVTAGNGRTLRAQRSASETGHASTPPDADVSGKFHSLSDPVIGHHRAAAIEDAVWRLPELADVGALARLLHGVAEGNGD